MVVQKIVSGGTRMATLQNRAKNAELKRQIEEDNLAAARAKKYSQYLNTNLRLTRKRGSKDTRPDIPERDFTNTDRKAAMGRARRKVEECPMALGMLTSLTDNIIGTGFRLSMRTEDDGFNREVESLWNLQKDTLDIRGIRPWYELQRMWYMRRGVDGDVGINLVPGAEFNEGGEKKVQSHLQTVEGDRIYKKWSGAEDYGIDFDEVGRPIRYYTGPRVKDRTDVSNKTAQGTPIPASNFILYAYYPQNRVERKRGVSQFLQALNVITDLEQLIENMLMKVENESFIGLKFKMEPSADGTLFGNAQETKNDEEGTSRKHVKMVPGMNLHLDDGEDADILESKNPSEKWIDFIRFIIRYMGTNFGLPLMMTLMDTNGLNYSTMKGMLEMAKRRFTVEQKSMMCVSTRVFQWWLSRQTKYKIIKIPRKIQKFFWDHKWGCPGWPYLDPLKEVQAQGMMVDRGFKSNQQILAEIGDVDFEDMVAMRKREMEMLKEAGLPLSVSMPGSQVVT